MYKYRLWIVISALTFIIAVGLVYISVNDLPGLNDSISICESKIVFLEDKLEEKDFAYTCADMEISNLQQIIGSKDEFILELKVKEEMYYTMKDVLKSSLWHILELKTIMDKHNIPYPAFVVDSLLDDTFYEDIEEQVEFFEENSLD